jgi:glycosyltransferase involved in cell wall biosynthesis
LVSVVIPARNEERTIGATVRAMLAQTYADLEVIVVNDRSTDRTAEILAAIGDPRLVVIDGEEPPPDWLGKPWACDQGCRAARGELLLIVDADVQYGPGALAAMVAYMNEHGEIAMLAVLPRFELHGFWENLAMPMLAVTAFMFIPSWLANQTTIAAFGIGGGTGNFVRRRDFDETGGYAALHAAVVDDVGMARQLRAHGKRTHAVRAEEFISLRMYHGASEIIDGFTKNLFTAFGGFAGICTLLPLLLLFHFVPYLLLFRGDALVIAAVVLISLSRLILFRSIGLRIDNALLGHPLMIAFWAWIFIRSTWLTGVRKQVQWRGRTYERTWTRFGARR